MNSSNMLEKSKSKATTITPRTQMGPKQKIKEPSRETVGDFFLIFFYIYIYFFPFFPHDNINKHTTTYLQQYKV